MPTSSEWRFASSLRPGAARGSALLLAAHGGLRPPPVAETPPDAQPTRKRRAMSAEEKKAVSERMTVYWAERRKGRAQKERREVARGRRGGDSSPDEPPREVNRSPLIRPNPRVSVDAQVRRFWPSAPASAPIIVGRPAVGRGPRFSPEQPAGRTPGALRRLDAWLASRPLEDATLAAYLAELHHQDRGPGERFASHPSHDEEPVDTRASTSAPDGRVGRGADAPSAPSVPTSPCPPFRKGQACGDQATDERSR